MKLHAVLLAIALACAATAGAQIYKWTDSTGKVHYSDKAPDDAARKELKLEVQSFDAPPRIERGSDVMGRRLAEGGNPERAAGLTMYATSWCGYCRKARAYLAEKGISYREVDVEANAANNREFIAYGGRGVPLFVAGDKTMRGFTPQAMDRFLSKK